MFSDISPPVLAPLPGKGRLPYYADTVFVDSRAMPTTQETKEKHLGIFLKSA
jgi:hypothetical protein